MPEQSDVLALDIGTSSTRAILYDATGSPVPDLSAQLPYTLTTSQEGEASVEADFLVDLVARSIDELLQKAGERTTKIAAVALSTFWHTLVPLDADGKPLLPLMTWEDTRPRHAVEKLNTLVDADALHERTGARLHASYWPAKILWLSTAHPDIARRTARYVSFGEYLHERLLGRTVCSLSMASGTGLLNRHTHTWESELLDLLHLSPDHFSPLDDLSSALRGLTPEFSHRWPALKDVDWFPAIGDGAAANFGSDCANTSHWAVTVGTSSAMRVVVPPEQVTPNQGLWLYAVDRERALLGGALSEGGNLLAWLRKTLSLPELPEMEKEAAQLEPAAHGLTILPLLTGERSPGWHGQVSMTISGLTSHSTPVEITRATLEALAFQLSRVYDQISHTLSVQVTQPRLIASGAALLKSPLLCQIVADTLNRPLELFGNNEASARGAALLALEALKIVPDLTRLAPPSLTSVQPDPAKHRIYQQARERQQKLYTLLLE